MAWWEWLLIAVAGAFGASLRYIVESAVSTRFDAFPAGTLVVNLTGSFVLGLLTGLALYHGVGGAPREVLGTGFVGAYTTFSAFSLETAALIEDGETRLALANVGVSLAGGGLLGAAGWGLAAL